MGEDRTGRDQAGDRPTTGRRFTVSEAAGVLGISVEAVRGRIKRKKLDHVKEDGTVYVLLDIDRSISGETSQRPENDQSEVVAVLKEEVAYLREESRRKDEIIMQQALTMRALSAPSEETPGDAETVEEGEEPPDEAGSPQTATETPTAGRERRPWWRRVFGG